MALWYAVLKGPKQSRLLIKPLTKEDGGIEHSGGNKLEQGAYAYERIWEWVNGAKVPDTYLRSN